MYYGLRGARIQFAVPRAGLRTSDLVLRNDAHSVSISCPYLGANSPAN